MQRGGDDKVSYSVCVSLTVKYAYHVLDIGTVTLVSPVASMFQVIAQINSGLALTKELT